MFSVLWPRVYKIEYLTMQSRMQLISLGSFQIEVVLLQSGRYFRYLQLLKFCINIVVVPRCEQNLICCYKCFLFLPELIFRLSTFLRCYTSYESIKESSCKFFLLLLNFFYFDLLFVSLYIYLMYHPLMPLPINPL